MIIQKHGAPHGEDIIIRMIEPVTHTFSIMKVGVQALEDVT